MIFPKKLQKGDTIGIVSPSSQVSAERVTQAEKALKDLGFQVKLSDNHACCKGGYMAGEESVRGTWINRMFADPEVDAIFCMRGGDGANRIIDFIDLDVIRSNPKIFVGYSDITSLHLLFNQECDLVTFHGPMVSSNIVDHFDAETSAALFASLTDDTPTYAYKAPKGMELQVARHGKAEGLMTGGNLTVMCNALGTFYDMDTKDKIIFIEEIGGHIGNMDRCIYQLRNAGKLEDAVGILLGQFTECRYETEHYDMVNILLEATADLNLPILYNVQSGHGFPMINLPMHANCRMDTESKTIVFDMNNSVPV